jgi:DNA polymerase-3 subunit gamma/tau
MPSQVTKPEPKKELSVAPLKPRQVQVLAPEFTSLNWVEILEALSLSGVAASLAANCQLCSAGDQQCVLRLSENHASLWNKTYEVRIAEALGQLYGHEIKVSIEVGTPSVETPAQLAGREKQRNLAQAVADIQGDQYVQQLIENFNGKLDPKSIAPLGD